MEQFFLKLPVQINEDLIEEQLIGINFISRISPYHVKGSTNEYSRIEFKDSEHSCIIKLSFEALTELIRKRLVNKNLLPIL